MFLLPEIVSSLRLRSGGDYIQIVINPVNSSHFRPVYKVCICNNDIPMISQVVTSSAPLSCWTPTAVVPIQSSNCLIASEHVAIMIFTHCCLYCGIWILEGQEQGTDTRMTFGHLEFLSQNQNSLWRHHLIKWLLWLYKASIIFLCQMTYAVGCMLTKTLIGVTDNHTARRVISPALQVFISAVHKQMKQTLYYAQGWLKWLILWRIVKKQKCDMGVFGQYN